MNKAVPAHSIRIASAVLLTPLPAGADFGKDFLGFLNPSTHSTTNTIKATRTGTRTITE